MSAHLFTGNALCPIGPRGRMVLPPFIRAILACKESAGRVFIGLHEADPCLVAIDHGELAALRSDCRRRRIAEEAAAPGQGHMRLRRIFGLMDDVWVRDSGRIEIPPVLLDRAGLGEAALVIGTGTSFELWNPRAALDAGDPDLRALATWHLGIREAA